MANVATHLHLVDAHEKSGRENNLELRVQYTLLGNFFLEGPTKEMVMYFLSQYQTIRNSTLEDWFLSKYCHSRKMIIKTWFQSNLTLEENSGFRAWSQKKSFWEIDRRSILRIWKIYKKSIFSRHHCCNTKHDHSRKMIVKTWFQSNLTLKKKSWISGFKLQKNEKLKSTKNRFQDHQKSTRNRFLWSCLANIKQ